MKKDFEIGTDKDKFREHILNSNNSIYTLNQDEEIADFRNKGFSMLESSIYDLKRNDYREYISTWESYQPLYRNFEPSGICEYDQLVYNNIFDDKYLFSLVFGNYVNVPKTFGLIYDGKIVSVDKDFSCDDLYGFLSSIGGGVIKYREGANGFGIYVFDVENGMLLYKNELIEVQSLNKIVQKFRLGIIQEKICQGKWSNSLFENSVNTIRIISIRKRGEIGHEIACALQRIGTSKSAPVDNFAQGGGTSLINIENGTLGPMVNYDSCGSIQRLSKHPDTGRRVEGEQVPNWQEIKSIVESVTLKLPFFVYAAWDIVVKDDGISVIEINKKSSLDLFQVHGGLRNSLLGRKYKENDWLVDF